MTTTVGGTDLRIFRDRQRRIGDRADDQEQDRQHHREDRLIDRKTARIHRLRTRAARACRRLRVGVTLRADAGALQPVEMTLFLRLEALAYDPQAIDRAAELHRPRLDRVVLP